MAHPLAAVQWQGNAQGAFGQIGQQRNDGCDVLGDGIHPALGRVIAVQGLQPPSNRAGGETGADGWQFRQQPAQDLPHAGQPVGFGIARYATRHHAIHRQSVPEGSH